MTDPFSANSDQHVMFSYNISTVSHIQVMRANHKEVFGEKSKHLNLPHAH